MQDERADDADVSCLLPGGLLLGNAWRRHATLRPLTGREEQWLARHPRIPSAHAATRLLRACLVQLDGVDVDREMVGRMLVGDRDYLILQLRRLTHGDLFSAILTCPACAAKIDVDFRATDIPVEWRPQSVEIYSVDLGRDETSRRTVRFRLPTGGDQEAVSELDGAAAADTLFCRCLIDGDVPLAPDERGTVIEAMEQRAPMLDLDLDLTCPTCGHAFVAPFDTTTFFLEEMRVSGPQLLREVHSLALYYHWSEADILGLTRARRRAYLALLHDALRRE